MCIWDTLRVFLELILSIEKIHLEEKLSLGKKRKELGEIKKKKKTLLIYWIFFFFKLLGVCLLVSEEESQLILGRGSFGKENC